MNPQDVNSNPNSDDRTIDLGEVRRLVAALEAELAQVQSGSKDVQDLRDEVEALRHAVHGEAPEHEVVGSQLHRVHTTLGDKVEALEVEAIRTADYVARIGRLLGLS